MARHHNVPGRPGSVRNKRNIHGLPGNTPAQQAEADKGTRMATQAAEIYEAEINSCIARRVSPLGLLENPPGSEESGSAWNVPQVDACPQRTPGKKIRYCAYQLKEKLRFLKPGIWAGRIENIEKIQKVCRCPAWVVHTALVGKGMMRPS